MAVFFSSNVIQLNLTHLDTSPFLRECAENVFIDWLSKAKATQLFHQLELLSPMGEKEEERRRRGVERKLSACAYSCCLWPESAGPAAVTSMEFKLGRIQLKVEAGELFEALLEYVFGNYQDGMSKRGKVFLMFLCIMWVHLLTCLHDHQSPWSLWSIASCKTFPVR